VVDRMLIDEDLELRFFDGAEAGKSRNSGISRRTTSAP
jgi:hypothetical protein